MLSRQCQKGYYTYNGVMGPVKRIRSGPPPHLSYSPRGDHFCAHFRHVQFLTYLCIRSRFFLIDCILIRSTFDWIPYPDRNNYNAGWPDCTEFLTDSIFFFKISLATLLMYTTSIVAFRILKDLRVVTGS